MYTIFNDVDKVRFQIIQSFPSWNSLQSSIVHSPDNTGYMRRHRSKPSFVLEMIVREIRFRLYHLLK